MPSLKFAITVLYIDCTVHYDTTRYTMTIIMTYSLTNPAPIAAGERSRAHDAARKPVLYAIVTIIDMSSSSKFNANCPYFQARSYNGLLLSPASNAFVIAIFPTTSHKATITTADRSNKLSSTRTNRVHK